MRLSAPVTLPIVIRRRCSSVGDRTGRIVAPSPMFVWLDLARPTIATFGPHYSLSLSLARKGDRTLQPDVLIKIK